MGFAEFLRSLVRSSIDGLRRNKLPVVLSCIALVFTAALAFTSDYDERPRYRQLILPKIEKAETQFFDVMREAESEPDPMWRLLYFIEGHRRAKAVLRVASEERPTSAAARKAQGQLVRYYELVDEQLAIIRTEASFNDSYDYVAEWNRRNAELMRIRERWVAWLGPTSKRNP